MSATDLLFSDLLGASGPFMMSALEAQADSVKRRVNDALAAGAWVEVRVAFRDADAVARVVVTDLATGNVTELARLSDTRN